MKNGARRTKDPQISGPALDLERYVPALLVFISNKLTHGSAPVYRRRFGVGVSEWRVLAMLAVEPRIPAQRICQVIGFDKALVSRVVRQLAARGLASVLPDKRDSRRSFIALTAKGRKLHDRVLAVALERERILLSDLAPGEVDQLIGLLHRLHARIGEVNTYDPGRIPLSGAVSATRRNRGARTGKAGRA